MSKELRRKVIEAGIVPAQAVKLMQMWKMLDDDDLPEVGKQEQTEEQLLEFVSDIAQMLEKTETLPEMRETMLDLTSDVFDLRAEFCRVLVRRNDAYYGIDLRTFEDAHGWYLFRCETEVEREAIRVGSVIHFHGAISWIIDTMLMYCGDRPQYIRCRVRGVPQADLHLVEERNAEVSQVRRIDKE